MLFVPDAQTWIFIRNPPICKCPSETLWKIFFDNVPTSMGKWKLSPKMKSKRSSKGLPRLTGYLGSSAIWLLITWKTPWKSTLRPGARVLNNIWSGNWFPPYSIEIVMNDHLEPISKNCKSMFWLLKRDWWLMMPFRNKSRNRLWCHLRIILIIIRKSEGRFCRLV